MLGSDKVEMMHTTFNHLVVMMVGSDITTFNHLVVIMLGLDMIQIMQTSFNHLDHVRFRHG